MIAHAHRLVAAAVKQYGRLDIMIANAGGGGGGLMAGMTDERFRRILAAPGCPALATTSAGLARLGPGVGLAPARRTIATRADHHQHRSSCHHRRPTRSR